VGLWRAANELVDEAPGDRRGKQGVAPGYDAHRRDQLLGRAVLEQKSAGTGAERFITAPACLVNGTFLDAEFGPAFLLFLLWVMLASIVLTLRAGRATVEAAAGSRAAQPVSLR